MLITAIVSSAALVGLRAINVSPLMVLRIRGGQGV